LLTVVRGILLLDNNVNGTHCCVFMATLNSFIRFYIVYSDIAQQYTHNLYFRTVHAIRDSSQPDIPQTSTSGTHTHRQHTASHRINNWTKQTRGDVVATLSTKDDPLRMVKHW
jgi:hypothetical protein